MTTGASDVPYILRALRGEQLERPPVWMMRQAGRYMKIYRDLRTKYPSFRDRSENPDLAIEISLQPYRAFKPDGVIMFSDILTPLPGLGINFEIVESKGPVIENPIRTMDQVSKLTPFEPDSQFPFIKTILNTLRAEVDSHTTVLGFVGAPWTLAAYSIEGKSSKDYAKIKAMAFSEPTVLHAFLAKLADAIAQYACYQIESGAQVVQLFDSWAGQLCPQDFETFALPYIKMVVDQVKAKHPTVPLILYISGGSGILERMAKSGVDVISVDWTVDMAEARQRLGPDMMVQGNIDPGVLFGAKDFIRDRILETIKKAGPTGHVLNLGHGIISTTPEENAAFFFETAKHAHELLVGAR
ncbi:MAG: uroporphyrinogen decarboxylase [Cyanobacteria bacterium P01_C01_bin.89]